MGEACSTNRNEAKYMNVLWRQLKARGHVSEAGGCGILHIGMKGAEWIHLAQTWDTWQAVMHTMMNSPVSKHSGHPLTSYAAISFSSRTPLNGIRMSAHCRDTGQATDESEFICRLGQTPCVLWTVKHPVQRYCRQTSQS
jgi:hypothetical protein